MSADYSVERLLSLQLNPRTIWPCKNVFFTAFLEVIWNICKIEDRNPCPCITGKQFLNMQNCSWPAPMLQTVWFVIYTLTLVSDAVELLSTYFAITAQKWELTSLPILSSELHSAVYDSRGENYFIVHMLLKIQSSYLPHLGPSNGKWWEAIIRTRKKSECNLQQELQGKDASLTVGRPCHNSNI